MIPYLYLLDEQFVRFFAYAPENQQLEPQNTPKRKRRQHWPQITTFGFKLLTNILLFSLKYVPKI